MLLEKIWRDNPRATGRRNNKKGSSEPKGKEFYILHKPVVRESAESTKSGVFLMDLQEQMKEVLP